MYIYIYIIHSEGTLDPFDDDTLGVFRKHKASQGSGYAQSPIYLYYVILYILFKHTLYIYIYTHTYI